MGNTAYVITGNTLLGAALAVFVTVAALVLFVPRLRRRWVWCFFAVASLCISGCVLFYGLNDAVINGGIPPILSTGYAFTGAAVIVFFSGLYLSVMRKKHRLWFFAGSVFFTVLALHIAVNFAHPADYADVATALSLWAIFARAATSLFQTFSLDAAYVEILRAGEAVFAGGSAAFCLMFLLMSVVAPIAGGFAIFGLLCHFFPYLWLYVLCGRKTRYVFSELNEYSIETAESIARNRNMIRADKRLHDKQAEWLLSSVIIFTDAYADGDSERASELLDRARKIGAICLKDDITECDFPWAFWRRCKLFAKSREKSKIVYFLMDADEQNNLKAATAILAPENVRLRKVKNVELYVFTQNGDAHDVLKKSYENLLQNSDKEQLNLYFKTINEYKNLIYRLIDGYDNATFPSRETDEATYPLYYNLVHGKDYDLSKLSVVVVGGGKIGKEFIKAAYWCGQMLSSVEPTGDSEGLPFCTTALSVTVIAQNAGEAERRLRFEMPEVFDADVQKHGYCDLEFIQADFGSVSESGGAFVNAFESHCADADYVLVALGDDELNMQAAHWIKRVLDRKNILAPKPVPINYVIENDGLCRSLSLSDGENSKSGGILHAFGSLAQRYDYGNVYMTAIEQRAWVAAMTHGKAKNIQQFLMQDYALNSSIATALHYPYKLVVFKGADSADMARAIRNAKAAVCWIEHRRWCSYIRSTGMRCPTAREFLSYAFENAAYSSAGVNYAKNTLKLHACLLETGVNFPAKEQILQARADNADVINALLTEKVCDGETTLADWLMSALDFLPDNFDLLDRLSVVMNYNYKDSDVDIVLNLYDDARRANIIDGCVHSDLSACRKAALTLTDMHTAGDNDERKIFACGRDLFVHAGVYDKYEILVARFDSPPTVTDGYCLNLRVTDALCSIDKKSHGQNFIHFFDDVHALIGVSSANGWQFGDSFFYVDRSSENGRFTRRYL